MINTKMESADESAILEKMIQRELTKFVGNVAKLRVIYNFMKACK